MKSPGYGSTTQGTVSGLTNSQFLKYRFLVSVYQHCTSSRHSPINSPINSLGANWNFVMTRCVCERLGEGRKGGRRGEGGVGDVRDRCGGKAWLPLINRVSGANWTWRGWFGGWGVGKSLHSNMCALHILKVSYQYI